MVEGGDYGDVGGEDEDWGEEGEEEAGTSTDLEIDKDEGKDEVGLGVEEEAEVPEGLIDEAAHEGTVARARRRRRPRDPLTCGPTIAAPGWARIGVIAWARTSTGSDQAHPADPAQKRTRGPSHQGRARSHGKKVRSPRRCWRCWRRARTRSGRATGGQAMSSQMPFPRARHRPRKVAARKRASSSAARTCYAGQACRAACRAVGHHRRRRPAARNWRRWCCWRNTDRASTRWRTGRTTAAEENAQLGAEMAIRMQGTDAIAERDRPAMDDGLRRGRAPIARRRSRPSCRRR